jgi:hypothetical protein
MDGWTTILHCYYYLTLQKDASNIITITNSYVKHVAQTNPHSLYKFFLFGGYGLPYLGRFHPLVVCTIIFVEWVAQFIKILIIM